MYCAQTDIEDLMTSRVLMQLTDDSRTDTVDTEKVAAAIGAASDEVDAYLRARYAPVPLPDPVPGLIKRLTRDLAVYELYSRRLEGGIPEAVTQRAKEARALLAQIRDGLATLGVEPPSGSGNYRTNKAPCDRVFNKHVQREAGEGLSQGRVKNP